MKKLSFNPEILAKFLQSNALLYCVVFLLALRILSVAVDVNFPQNIFFADITKVALENFANQTRQSLGLNPLVENQKLEQAAKLKAENMVQNQYFSHISPTGVTPWHWFMQTGYNYKYAGENLAIGFFDSKEVFNAWLNSPSHKANLVNPNYEEIGTAVLEGFGNNNTIVVVQLFGSQKTAPVATTPAVKKPVVKAPGVKPVETQPVAKTQQALPTTEKVLSASDKSFGVIEMPKNSLASNFYSKFLNFVIYSYEGLLQDVILGTSLIVIGILLSIMFLNMNMGAKRQLVLRSVLILALLLTATLVNKDILILLIPHQIII